MKFRKTWQNNRAGAFFSPESLAKHEDEVGDRVAAQIAGFVDDYARGYARTDSVLSLGDSSVVAVLEELADNIRKSKFPARPATLLENHQDPKR